MTRQVLFAAAMAFALAVPARAGDLVARDTTRESLRFPPGPRRMLVDNISGTIDVAGYDGNDVQLVAVRTIRADSEERLREGQSKVTLDLRSESDRVLLYVNAPWRCKDGGVNYQGRDYYGYDAEVDFVLKVPTRTSYTLKTVNGDGITVRKMDGSFEVRNVNGRIEMGEITGSGTASTVNGSVVVDFVKQPAEASAFKTINGRIEVSFPDDLSADLKFSTLNGELYTDFPVHAHADQKVVHEIHGRRNIYRRDDFSAVQVGAGGPEFSFSTLNGNIYVLKKEKE